MREGMRLECCEAMKHAQESGTDNEGYGSAVWDRNIGIGLPEISFCPWCGEAVRCRPGFCTVVGHVHTRYSP